ncbi:MAG TPA: MlaD family protein [Solirubrobacteraceae bacterium]|nr:MlaD family protein [Solirubrobacteraceae bacterium]
MRRRRDRISSFAAGVIGTVVIAVVCYLVFGGGVPWGRSPFVLKAVLTSETQLHIPSPVRIAGVDVGQVVSVKSLSSSSQLGVVTMDIDRDGLPIHGDATLRVVPRIFLEGNFYIDLHPGTPGAPILSSGATLPVANTSGPVQLDRVLSTLTGDARTNLQTLLSGLGSALNAPATAQQDRSQDPSVRGLTGAQSLNLSLKYSAEAFRASAIVNDALLGIQPHDLSGVVTGTDEVLRGLAASGDQLPGLVSNFDATLAALAARQHDLGQTIALLPPWLTATDRALGPLNASFAPTKAFAHAILPGLTQLDPTIRAALPWLAQSKALLSQPELGTLLKSLTPAVDQTASALASTEALIASAHTLARCFDTDLIPTGNEVIQDPPIGTGLPLYQELFQSAVGLAGASQNFDGNGRYIRSLAGGGSVQGHTSSIPGQGPLYANFVLPPLGTRPVFPGQAPPLRSSLACYRNTPPDLNAAQLGQTP